MRRKQLFALVLLFGVSLAPIFVTDFITDTDFPWLIPITDECVSCEAMEGAPEANMVLIFDQLNFRITPMLYFNNVSAVPMRQPMPNAVIIVHIYNTTGFSEVVKIYTDSEGKAEFDFSPYNDSCKNYKFLYCPFCCPTEPGYPCGFQECLDFANIPSAGIPTPEDVPDAEGHSLDISSWNCNKYLPATDSTSYCPPPPLGAATPVFCLPLLIIFSLLGGALYLSGQNPLRVFNIGTPRVGAHIRYQARARGMSINIQMIAASISGAVKEAKSIKAKGKAQKLQDQAKKLAKQGDKAGAALLNKRAAALRRKHGLVMRGGKVAMGGGPRWFLYSDIKDAAGQIRGGIPAFRRAAKAARGRKGLEGWGKLWGRMAYRGLKDMGKAVMMGALVQSFTFMSYGEMMKLFENKKEQLRDERGFFYASMEDARKQMEAISKSSGIKFGVIQIKKTFKVGDYNVTAVKLDTTGNNGTVTMKTAAGTFNVQIKDGIVQSVAGIAAGKTYIAKPLADGGTRVEVYAPKAETPTVYNVTQKGQVQQETPSGMNVVSDKKIIADVTGLQKASQTAGSRDFKFKVDENSVRVTKFKTGVERHDHNPLDLSPERPVKSEVIIPGGAATPDLVEMGGARAILKEDGTFELKDSAGKKITNKAVLAQANSFLKRNLRTTAAAVNNKTGTYLTDYAKASQKYAAAKESFQHFDRMLGSSNMVPKNPRFGETATQLHNARLNAQKQVTNPILRRLGMDDVYTLSVSRPGRPIMPSEADRIRVEPGDAAARFRSATNAHFHVNMAKTDYAKDLRKGDNKRLPRVSYDMVRGAKTVIDIQKRIGDVTGIIPNEKQAKGILKVVNGTRTTLDGARRDLRKGLQLPDVGRIARRNMNRSMGTPTEQKKTEENLTRYFGSRRIGEPPASVEERNNAAMRTAAELARALPKGKDLAFFMGKKKKR